MLSHEWGTQILPTSNWVPHSIWSELDDVGARCDVKIASAIVIRWKERFFLPGSETPARGRRILGAMKATAMVCDRLECVRVTVVSIDLPSNCWQCEFETPEDACVALEEVGILPVGETSYAVRNNFDNGVLLAQGELQHEDTLLAAGFRSEEFWVVN